MRNSHSNIRTVVPNLVMSRRAPLRSQRLRLRLLVAAGTVVVALLTTHQDRKVAYASRAIQVDTIPVHDSFTVRSKSLGEPRLINVYTPPQYRAQAVGKAQSVPVLYMPDGAIGEDFPHVARTVDSLIKLHIIRPLMIVGIPNTERRRDLTSPTRVASDSTIAPHVGGSAAFRRFIRDELFPEIDRRYRTTPERGIIGESLAGLFIVETLLDQPSMFTHYIAFDPSLWWNNGALVDSASNRIAAFPASARTLYLASSKEPSTYVGCARIDGFLKAAKPPAFTWTYLPRTDLTHDNIFVTLIAPALIASWR